MSKANTISARINLMVFILITALGLSASAASAGFQDSTRLRLVTTQQAAAERPTDPAGILATARTMHVRSRTVLVKSEVIESALGKRTDFQQSGLILTKDSLAADLTMEVRRSNFTTEYPYVVIDSRTQAIVASGKVNSLFGTAAGKIAKGFMKQVQKARSAGAANSKK